MPLKMIALPSALVGAFVAYSTAWAAGEAPPPSPAPAMMRLVGQYGSGSDLLEIYESGGHLFADGDGFHQAELVPATPGAFKAADKTLIFAKGVGEASSVSLDGAPLPAAISAPK